jgi:hypothetical protein
MTAFRGSVSSPPAAELDRFELWLKIFPITLGSGKRLFADGTSPAAFRLTDSKVSPLGVIIANYKRAGEVKTGTLGA